MAKIFVIDDDDQVRDMLCQMLEQAGHETVDFPSAVEGMEAFRKSPAELVIVDILMPEKDGLQMIQELVVEFPDAPIIAISGGMKGNTAWLPIARKIGAKRVIKKPFEMSFLLDAVSEVLAQSA